MQQVRRAESMGCILGSKSGNPTRMTQGRGATVISGTRLLQLGIYCTTQNGEFVLFGESILNNNG